MWLGMHFWQKEPARRPYERSDDLKGQPEGGATTLPTSAALGPMGSQVLSCAIF